MPALCPEMCGMNDAKLSSVERCQDACTRLWMPNFIASTLQCEQCLIEACAAAGDVFFNKRTRSSSDDTIDA